MNEYDKNYAFWRDFAGLEDNPYMIHADLSDFRCLFVHLTKEGDFTRSDYPIALGYMASLLRMNGGSATISIQHAGSYIPEVYSNYDLICFFPMSALLRQLLDLTTKVKEDYPQSKTCFFNSEQHQHEMMLCAPKSVDFGRTLMEEYPSIDFVLIGEAEAAFLSLCKNLAEESHNLADVPSCLYRQAGMIKLSERKIEPANFRYLPFPSRDFLDESINHEGVNSHSPRVQSSRGCISRCLYCVESSTNITDGGRKRPWSGRDIARFVDEIEMLSTQYGVVFFNIIDSSFEDPGRRGIERVRTFCEEVISRGIEASFKVHFRTETFDKLGDDFLRLLKQAGIDILIVGAESGVDSELRSYKKMTTVQKNLDNIHRLDDFGEFFVLLGHIMFSPYLELHDLLAKVNFLREVHRGWDYLNLSNNLLVFRGTAYHDLIKEDSLTSDDDKLSAVIPYRYIDERVKLVSEEMGNLRIKCPEVALLHNLLYDALNISARYHNRMNRHLWEKDHLFQQFRNGLKELLLQIEDVYCGYFLKLVELADTNWTDEKKTALYCEWIPISIHIFLNRVRELIDECRNSFNKAGLSTAKLYLKTWMSLINKETNTSGGRVRIA